MKLSIIVPVYNVEKTLKRCVDSILRQRLDNYELLLIDDGSPDNSGAMATQKHSFHGLTPETQGGRRKGRRSNSGGAVETSGKARR